MNLTQLQKYQVNYPALPVTLSFKMDDFDAINLTNNLQINSQTAFLFTGQPKPNEDGYSFIGLDPEMTITYRDGILTTESGQQIIHKKIPLKPFLEELLQANKVPLLPDLPPFLGGLTGYFSYDYARFANPTLPQNMNDPYKLNDADFLSVKTVIAYNHKTNIVTLSKILSSDDLDEQYQPTIEELIKLKKLVLQNNHLNKLPTFHIDHPFKLQFDQAEFAQKVAQTKTHIIDGDIFQLILSNPQHTNIDGSLFGLTKTLFADSPAPYQFYYHHNNFETVGSSPETLISKHGDKLFTYPLAGTRRRGKTPEEDQKLADELTHSPKELSEHNMLIDLGRNDLGRVSQFGSVKVTKTRKLLRFSNVMHMGSTVESLADQNHSAIDIVESLMPAGTLSGAPKISAMQIIADLEKQKRGIYGGCLGYFAFSGDLDFCIGIRLAYRQKEHLVVHSGAGIVADSIAKREFQEFNNKARNVLDAISKVTDKEELA